MTNLLSQVYNCLDNDDGAKDVFAIIKGKFGITIQWNSKDSFYHITDNLYLVKTPERGTNHMSSIEDLFDKVTLATELEGKSFNKANTAATANQYGKYVFAEKVVQAQANTINFDGFVPLLSRIVMAIGDHKP
jgi:RNA-directed DNA polymerase